MLLQIKSSMLHLAAIVADGQCAGRRLERLSGGDHGLSARFTNWHVLEFAVLQRKAITSQINIQVAHCTFHPSSTPPPPLLTFSGYKRQSETTLLKWIFLSFMGDTRKQLKWNLSDFKKLFSEWPTISTTLSSFFPFWFMQETPREKFLDNLIIIYMKSQQH